MLDIKFIAENTDWVKKSLARKGFDEKKVDELLNTYYEMNKYSSASQVLGLYLYSIRSTSKNFNLGILIKFLNLFYNLIIHFLQSFVNSNLNF